MRQIFLLLSFMIIVPATAQLKTVSYSDGAQKLTGIAVVPSNANKEKSGILILPAWKGITDHEKETATALADLGYHTFIADIYGEGNYPTDSKSAGERSGFYKKNFELYQKRIKLALDQLISSGAAANKVVVIGYCFGGTGALEAARGNLPVVGVVSFHGGLGKDKSRENKSMKAKVLVLHGADDPYVPVEDIMAFQQEMRDSQADWQMIYYADAVHAFTEKSAGNDKSKGAAYNEKADKRSWEHMLLFLKELLN